MRRDKAFAPVLAAIASLSTIAASMPAMAQGAQGEMFQRHFFRGQAYHGEGYAAQVNEMGRKAPRHATSGGSSLEAVVESGTPEAAAVDCAARFRSHGSATNIYVARGGRRRACR